MKRAISYQRSAFAGMRNSDSRPSAIRDPQAAIRRLGFTLIELLVVVSILAVIMTITFTAYTRTNDAERVRAAARQIQSYVEGARDRAIHAHEPRGVRFLLDPTANNAGVPRTVSSMVFIGAPEKFTSGRIQLDNSTTPPTVAESINPGMAPVPSWSNLQGRLLLNTNGTPRIKVIINSSTSEYFHMARDGGVWKLTRTPTVAYLPNTDYEYELELLPAVLPNQEPRLIARNIAVDLDKSVYPSSWATNPTQMDVMFSPRGTVIGDAAARGLIHFFIADTRDVLEGRSGVVGAFGPGYAELDPSVDLGSASTLQNSEEFAYRVILVDDARTTWIARDFVSIQSGPPWRVNFSPDLPMGFQPALVRVEPAPGHKTGDERIVTLAPQTGNISTHEANPDGDPFTFARLGALAK